ncbi:hypothetical protein [Streptomyces sp. NPDC002133]|uniref:hypothetical protein n=1 Tax=Streptomyces sp. NPDC002133 TaxID=3154409 RepID=UPI0033187B78
MARKRYVGEIRISKRTVQIGHEVYPLANISRPAGTQYTALSGTAYDEIERIKSEIVGAIEDPPQQERIVQVRGDLVMGDKIGRGKYQQSGSGNHINAGR